MNRGRPRTPPGGYFASPVVGGGNIYLASDRGRVTVVEPGDTLKVIARNDFEEPLHATPAIAGGWVYLRTKTHVYGFTDGASGVR